MNEPMIELPVQYGGAGMKAVPRLKPCPHCGEALVEKSDDHGNWYGHRDEVSECWASAVQIRDEVDAKRWNARPEKALPAPKPLKVKQLAFIQHYLVSGNATKAAIDAGYSAKTARVIGPENLQKPAIAAEIARQQKNIADAIGLRQIDIFRRMKNQAFTNITEVMGSPSTWPEEAKCAVKHYDAGGPQSGEKVTLHDQPRLLMELDDRLFGGKPNVEPAAPVTNVQMNIDKLLATWAKPLP